MATYGHTLKEGDGRLIRHGGSAYTMHVVEVALDLIDEGDRRREDYGDISGLAAGIKRVGLLHSIVVDEQPHTVRFRLVCGGRRLHAARLLGWKTIPAQLLKTLTEAELREIEFEENEGRKNLTERERARKFTSSKRVVDDAKKVAEVLNQNDSKPVANPKGGRPSKPASTRAIADALGTSQMSVVRAEQHVEMAEKYPFMKGDHWRQSHVLQVKEKLETIPESEHEQTMDVLKVARLLDPATALKLISNMAAMKPAERKEIYDFSKSTDPRDKDLALTKAARLPPMPDPRLDALTTALDALRRASRPYPGDPLTPRIEAIIAEVKAVRAAVKEVSYDARRDGGGTVQ